MVKDPPVPQVAPTQDAAHRPQVRGAEEACAQQEQEGAGARHDKNKYPEDEVAAGDEREGVEPEPKEQVDLLVDDVEREDAEAVELLLPGGGAHAVEGAAGKGDIITKGGSGIRFATEPNLANCSNNGKRRIGPGGKGEDDFGKEEGERAEADGNAQASSILNKVAGEEKSVAEKNVNNL